VTYLGVIEGGASSPSRRPTLRPFWRDRSNKRPRTHSDAATRFAELGAALGGTTMLHDLMPDVVTISFGPRTEEICERLHARGWTFVGAGDWQGEPVLGVSFSGDRRASRTAGELAEALATIVGEMHVADTRLW
jgi:hypothetical protein